MALSLTSKLVVDFESTFRSTLDLATGAVPLALKETVDLATGTGVGQADRIFHDQRTLAASTTEDLDLAGGLTDAYGNTITFVRVKGLLVVAAAANTNNVVVGAAAGSPWVGMLNSTGTITLPPGYWHAGGGSGAGGWPVVATTGDLLKIANSGAGTSVTYDIVIVGASA